MTIQCFTFNPFQTNCYVCHDGGEAALIDPSSSTESEHRVVVDYLAEQEVTVRHLLLTHAHIDHVTGCAYFAERFGGRFHMHRDDLTLLREAETQARLFGLEIDRPPEPAGFLEEGDTLSLGGATLEVLHTPGHSPGSVCFYEAAEQVVIGGDVLFQGSIGRTDLWQGSLPRLMESIFQKIVPLGDDVRVYPGHGPSTTVGRERMQNPFLTGPGMT